MPAISLRRLIPLILALAAAQCSAQTPRLVADLSPGFGPAIGSTPQTPILFGSTAYFLARDSTDGWALWRTDGTPEGTSFRFPVGNNGTTISSSQPTMRAIGNRLVAVLDRDLFAIELPSETRTPIRTFAESQYGIYFGVQSVQSPSSLFFTFSESTSMNPPAIWSTDGTVDGTRRVDIHTSFRFAYVQSLAYFANNLVVFGRQPGTSSPYGVFTIDPLTGLGRQLANLTDFARVSATIEHQGRLYFGNGNALWVTDGTPEGTRALSTFNANPSEFAVFAGRVYFAADHPTTGRELWLTDGTPEGTRVAADLVPGPTGSIPVLIPFTLLRLPPPVHNDRLLFIARAPPGAIFNILALDAAGTVTRLTNFLYNETPLALAAAGPHVYFFQKGGNSDRHWLYRLDQAAPTGATLLSESVGDGFYGRQDLYGVDLNGRLLFPDNDPLVLPTTSNPQASEPWVTDGTAQGTRQLANIRTNPRSSVASPLFQVGSRAVASISTLANSRQRPWITDGTAAGTFELFSTFSPTAHLKIISAGNSTHGMFVVVEHRGLPSQNWPDRSSLLFAPTPTSEPTLCREAPGNPVTELKNITPVGSRALFTDYGEDRLTPALYVTDGTPQGTMPLGNADVQPQRISAIAKGRSLVFALGLPSYSFGGPDTLIVTDGTHAGTRTVLPPSNPSAMPPIATVGDQAFFVKNSSRLWTSDGTTAGTTQIADFSPLGSIQGKMLSDDQSRVFVRIVYNVSGARLDRLAVADAAAASLLTDLGPQSDDAAALPGRLVYSRHSPDTGRELWVADADGGRLLRDLFPGPMSSSPAALTRIDGFVYFTANDGASGRELWRTDGTPEGTVRLDEVVPGPMSPGYPTGFSFIRAGPRIVLPLITRDEGAELWAFDRPPECNPDLNADGQADLDDFALLVSILAGGPNPTNVDPDFNRDGNADQDDAAALINTVGGGGCP